MQGAGQAQLDTIYGREAKGVLTKHRSKLFYMSGLSDTATTDYFSVLAGTEQVRGDLASRHPLAMTQGSDPNRAATAVPYAPAQFLRRLHVGDALLLHGQLPAAWIVSGSGAQEARDNR